MNHPRPSAATLSTLITVLERTVVSACVPKGEWLSFRPELPGYDVSQLLLVFKDNSSLNLWSETVRYGLEPWHEAFVLQSELRDPCASPLDVPNPGAISGFEVAAPLQEVFFGHRLEDPTLFVELCSYITNDNDDLTSDSLRLRVGAAYVDLMTEGKSVLPLSLALRSKAFPEHNTLSTGKREWLSSSFDSHRKASNESDRAEDDA